MRILTAVFTGILAAALPLRAQQRAAFLNDGTATGVTAGMWTASGATLGNLSLHVFELRAQRGGVAFSLAIPPKAWSNGGLVLGPDLGGAYNVSVPGATVLLKLGVSALVGLGSGGAEAYPGVHVGAALVSATSDRLGMLVDVTEHVYWDSGEHLSLLSLGVGLAVLPRLAL